MQNNGKFIVLSCLPLIALVAIGIDGCRNGQHDVDSAQKIAVYLPTSNKERLLFDSIYISNDSEVARNVLLKISEKSTVGNYPISSWGRVYIIAIFDSRDKILGAAVVGRGKQGYALSSISHENVPPDKVHFGERISPDKWALINEPKFTRLIEISDSISKNK